ADHGEPEKRPAEAEEVEDHEPGRWNQRLTGTTRARASAVFRWNSATRTNIAAAISTPRALFSEAATMRALVTKTSPTTAADIADMTRVMAGLHAPREKRALSTRRISAPGRTSAM